MFESITLEALTVFISPIVVSIVLYDLYRKGHFSKEKMEAERYAAQNPDFEKMSALSRWWWHSYIREIYVVRAGGRLWRCLIPWIGVFLSGIFVFVFAVWSYTASVEPPLPLDKLTERRGTFLFYTAKRRLSDQVTFLMEDGSTKSFADRCMDSEDVEKFTQQRVRFWMRRGSGLETCEFAYPDDGTDPLEAYEELYQARKELNTSHFRYLLLSLKLLLFFLLLIWLINLKPLKTRD